MSTQGNANAGGLSWLTAGRMPLWLAFAFSVVAGMGLSIILADVDLGTFPLGAGRISNLFVLFVIPPGLIAPTVARYKRRSVAKWTLTAFVAIMFSPVLPFLPLTVLLTLVLGLRIPLKVPQAELEAAENPRAMRQLVELREELWRLYQQTEDRYVHRDFAALTGLGETLDPIEERLERVREQRSDRGQNARLHLGVAVRQHRVVAEEADAVLAAFDEAPELAALAVHGSAMPAKGKPAKNLAKRLRRTEQMLNGAKIQISVAGGLLDALGYTAGAAEEGDEPNEPDEPDEPGNAHDPLPPPPTATRPRPQRPVRRRRH